MILYHGSNQLITRTDLSKSKDFSPEMSPFIFTPSRCSADVRIKKSVLLRTSRVDAILLEYRRSYGDAYANSTNLNKLAKQLKYPGPEYIQYCFGTEKGIRQLILDL